MASELLQATVTINMASELLHATVMLNMASKGLQATGTLNTAIVSKLPSHLKWPPKVFKPL